MSQLLMHWYNDGTKSDFIEFPSNIRLCSFTKLPNALREWMDICRHGLIPADAPDELYYGWMELKPNYNPNDCYFLLVDDEPAATFTVICDPDQKEGYLHMVACKDRFRGLGLGTLMTRLAIHIFKERHMESAYLDTDDDRLAAIHMYLKAGFIPDESTEDYRVRWQYIRQKLKQE